MIIEELPIKIFMKAWFKEDYADLSKEDFEIAYTEYVDISGMFVSKQFDLLSVIYNLDNRLTCIKLAVQTHLQYLDTFGEPYLVELDFFKKYGYSLLWKNDKEQFKKDLESILQKEKRYERELKIKKKEFDDLKDKDKSETKTLIQTRHDFIQMLNIFNRNGYTIDEDKTTVERLALMIKQNKEDGAKSA